MTEFTTYDAISDPTGQALIQALLSPSSGIVIQPGSVVLCAPAPSALSLYDGSLPLGIGSGLLLTSGTVPGTSNTVGWFGQDNSNWDVLDSNGMPLNYFNGDAAIDAVVNTVFQTQSFDATKLGFNFTAAAGATSISFDVVFGSDEYPEWVDQFVDCAVVIVNGVNYALFNHDPNAPLSVIGPNLAAGYFQDNAGNTLPIEYDGVSHVLKIVAPIKSGEVNSIMIAIADTGDHIYDSGIFISNFAAGTTPGSGVVITPDVPCTDSADTVTGGVADELLHLLGGDDTAYAGGGDDIVVAGEGNDKVYGGSGDDVLEGDGGDDYLDGGEGLANQAVYSGLSSAYSVVFDAVTSTYSVTGSEGADTLKSIQLLQFSNGLFDLNTDGIQWHAGETGVPLNQPGSVLVSGAGVVGQTLKAIVFDPDGFQSSDVSYEWLTSADGLTWTTSGNSKTFTVTADNAGAQVLVNVSYTDTSGVQEWASSSALTIAAKTDLAISLVQLAAPTGSGVQNPFTTLLSHAIELGFSGNESTMAIKTVLGLPDINLKTYDPVAILELNPLDATALSVLKICGELAMAACASDPTLFNLTLAVMDAASQGLTFELGDANQMATLLEGVGPDELDIVQTTCKDMAEAPNVAKIMAAWNDFCGNTDGMEAYQNDFANFNIHLNQGPLGNSNASLPTGTADAAYTIAATDLLAGFSDPDSDPLTIANLSGNTGGSFSYNGDGTWTFFPDIGFAGPVELSFDVTDGLLSTVGNAMFVITPAASGPTEDTTAPTVLSVEYGNHDGTLKAGETLSLMVTFSEAVSISGSPSLALANGGTATYTEGSGSSVLTFTYTVAPGQNSDDVSTALSDALSGAIADASGNELAASGLDGINPLGSVVVDTSAPAVVSLAYGSHDGTLKAGESVTLLVTLSESVTVSGSPSMALSNGGTAVYSGGSGTNTLTFTYNAASGQDTADLATALNNALNGVITDVAGNSVLAAGFNAVNPAGTLVVDTTAPTVTAFSPADGASLVALGAHIVLTLSEPITRGTGTISLYAGSPTGTLIESFDAALSNRISISNSTLTLDPSSNLANNTRYFVVLGQGTVTDVAGNAYGGTQTYDFLTIPAGNTLNGTANADVLMGTAGVDMVFGLGGNDTLTGGAGVDQLDGGEGSDLYIVALASDHGAAEFADSGVVGTDEVRFTSTVANSTLTLYAEDVGIDKVVIGTGTSANAVLTAKTALNVNASAITQDMALVGNAGVNTLSGGMGNDTLTGNAGIDTFNISAGTDNITDLGYGGADVLKVSTGATVNATVTAAWTASGNTVNQGVVNITSHGLAVNLAAITSTAMGNLGYHVSNTGTATTLTGSALSDWLTGAAGNDTLVGGGGVDVLDGAEGSDLYIVALAGDHAVAEFSDSGVSGTDEVRFTSSVANSTLTLYADDVGIDKVVIGTGTSASAVATGKTALNVNASALTTDIGLSGNAGLNVLSGGLGNDTLTGNAGADTFNVSAGTDNITDLGYGGADVLKVSTGATVNATVTAAWTASVNTVNQGVVNITSHGLAVNLAAITSTAMGNLGYHVSNTGTATTLTGSALSDWLTGAAGNDTLVGGGGVDVLYGAEGSDLYIVALAGDHAVAEFSDSGVSGTDEVRFTSTVANSTLTLYADDVGIEKVVIGTGTSASAVATGTSALNVNGSAMTEDISLVGNAGANVLSSGSGDDSLQGGSGHDTLNGGAGFDQLRGGNGNDILTGGADIDWFIFDTAANASTNKDTLKDFSSGEDLLMFSRAIYGGLSTSALGALDIEAFWSGANVTTAHDVSDRFIYNTTSGALYYDADGAGGNSALQVAVMGLTTHPTLACTDFFVVA